MFNNLINAHDVVVLFEKIKDQGYAQALGRITRSNTVRVAQAWSHTNDVPKNWWDIPEVEKRWNYLITGESETEPYAYVAAKYFSGRDKLNAISLGCGGGGRELKWVATGKIRHIDAYDVSQERIVHANAQAAKAGLADRVNYRVADVFDLEIQSESYDAILLEGALHHFSPLQDILQSINRWMKSDGYVIVNEYVGPSRFQWTKRQLEIVNGILSIMPVEYRTMLPNGKVKAKVYRPGWLSMYLNDPSEAAESSLILPVLNKMFDVVELREYGGMILPLLFKNIAHNFIARDEATLRILKLLFAIEDELMRCKEIQSHYIYAICRKRR